MQYLACGESRDAISFWASASGPVLANFNDVTWKLEFEGTLVTICKFGGIAHGYALSGHGGHHSTYRSKTSSWALLFHEADHNAVWQISTVS